MDESVDHPGPTLDSYRAFLAALRVWEAICRTGGDPGFSDSAETSLLLVEALYRNLGIEDIEADVSAPRQHLWRIARHTHFAAHDTFEAVGRLRLAAAIDALAAMIDLFEFSGRLAIEEQEAIESITKKRGGRPVENDERDAAAWGLHKSDEKWSVIASKLGYSDGDHARIQATRWAERNEQN